MNLITVSISIIDRQIYDYNMLLKQHIQDFVRDFILVEISDLELLRFIICYKKLPEGIVLCQFHLSRLSGKITPEMQLLLIEMM